MGFLCCCSKKEAKSPLGDVKCTWITPVVQYGMVPSQYRRCTDCLCLILFFMFWIGMIVVAAIAFSEGDAKRLIFGTDYRGETCGTGDLQDRRLITYPRYTQDYILNLDVTNPLNFKFYGVCVDSCPSKLDVVCNDDDDIVAAMAADGFNTIYTQEHMLNCLSGVTGSLPAQMDCDLVEASCYITPIDTSSVFFRCIPVELYSRNVTARCSFPEGIELASDPNCIIQTEDIDGLLETPAKPNQLFEQLNNVRNVWSRYFGDVERSWYVIVGCGIGAALVISFLWLYFLKCCAGVMVWATIVLVVLLTIAFTLFCYFKAGILDPDDFDAITDRLDSQVDTTQLTSELDSSEDNKNAFKYAAFIFTGVSIILLCVVVALRKSINTAIAVIKLGARALYKVPGMVFFPIFSVLLLLALFLWWIFVAASLASAGDISTVDIASRLSNSTFNNIVNINETFSFVDEQDVTKWLLMYHFFGLLWTNQFIQGISVATLAGSACGWYFSLNEANNPDADKYRWAQPRCAVWQSLKRTFRYHLGSIAFGSLLIAMIQFIRAVLAYMQRQSERAKDNRIVRCIMCCVQCCLKVLQTIVNIVTRNAFIFIALKGVSFCHAGRLVFKVIFDNLAVLAIVNMLGEVVMFLGKVVVACSSAFFAFWIFDTQDRFGEGGEDELTSTWLPVLVTLLAAYATASSFFYVYDIAVDSMLICFIVDGEENKQRGGEKVPIHVKPDMLKKLAATASGTAAAGAAAGTVGGDADTPYEETSNPVGSPPPGHDGAGIELAAAGGAAAGATAATAAGTPSTTAANPSSQRRSLF